jgi:hypothetical protein
MSTSSSTTKIVSACRAGDVEWIITLLLVLVAFDGFSLTGKVPSSAGIFPRLTTGNSAGT